MYNMPNDMYRPPEPQPQAPQRPPGRFRWGLVVIPLVVIVFFWFIGGISPSFQCEEAMDYFGIRHQDRYIRLVVLAIACVVVVMILKVFKNKKDEKL